MTEQTIDTEYGPARLLWDDQSGTEPGWFLRYHRDTDPEAIGSRNLDEYITATHADEALTEALAFLAREGIGAGRKLTSAQAAEAAGLRSATSWRVRVSEGRMPPCDDRYDSRTPWWWQTTVIRALAAKVGQGTRTDLWDPSEHGAVAGFGTGICQPCRDGKPGCEGGQCCCRCRAEGIEY